MTDDPLRRLRERLMLVYPDDGRIQGPIAALREGATPGEVAIVVELVARELARREAPP